MDDFIRSKRPVKPVLEDKKDDHEPDFVPPEVVASKDDGPLPTQHVPIPNNDKNPRKKSRLAFLIPKTKKQKIIFGVILGLFIVGSASGWWFGIRPLTNRSVTDKPLEKVPYVPPKPKTEASKLSGLKVDPSVNLRPVTAVMIENSPEARPQSGLKDAGVVFEAVAEGGITRFVALFQDTQPDYIGPIRSVRPYYIDWFMPFDASIAHVGGSPKGLADIKSLGAKDLDQFANSGAYSRVSNRYAPHNVYSSIARLNELMTKKGYTSANFSGFARKADAPSAAPTAKSITLNISSYYYNVRYDYDAASNSYLRIVGGAIHKDERSGSQLSPKVVVAIVMKRGIDSDGQHTAYTTTGSGKMYVFQDGVVSEGTWTKASRTAQWQFTDAAGAALAFNAGQTWFSMVDSPNSVIYQP